MSVEEIEAFDPSEYPAVAVLCPELPLFPALDDTSSTSQDLEAAALAYLCVFRPNSSELTMKGGHATWMDALRSSEVSSHGYMNNAQCREEWELDKQQGMERWVREIDWTQVFKDADPELYSRVFGTSYCAHCRARSGAASPSAPLLRCTVCRAVHYCSVECQKQAYWHHRRARNYDGHHIGCKKQ